MRCPGIRHRPHLEAPAPFDVAKTESYEVRVGGYEEGGGPRTTHPGRAGGGGVLEFGTFVFGVVRVAQEV